MLEFSQIGVRKENFHGAKASLKIWDANVDNISQSQSKHRKDLIGYLRNVIKPLVLTLPKPGRYVRTF